MICESAEDVGPLTSGELSFLSLDMSIANLTAAFGSIAVIFPEEGKRLSMN